jgi:hypothetical protein
VSESENVDVQRDILGERIEMAEIGNRVIRERIEEIERKLAALEEGLLE